MGAFRHACRTSTVQRGDSGFRFGGALIAQERTREAIPDKYKWNLSDLYASDAAWRAEKDALASTLGQAKSFAGTLGQSASQLVKALAVQTAQEKTLARLFAYANLASDQDTRVATYQGMSDEMTQLASSSARPGRLSNLSC